MTTNNPHLTAALEAARNRLDLETLETRNHDRLDFHTVSVESIRQVVTNAFNAGTKAKAEPDIFAIRDRLANMKIGHITTIGPLVVWNVRPNAFIAGREIDPKAKGLGTMTTAQTVSVIRNAIREDD